MTIRYAILGLLSWRPFSGYDLKKVFADSTAFYWSGNNNQIYTTLVELHKANLVSRESTIENNAHAKNVYIITDKGRVELKDWVLSNPQAPEMRNTFLVQLAWADRLSDKELDALLAKYEDEVHTAILIQQEKVRRGYLSPKRTPREIFLWEMISENILANYRQELDWAQRIRNNLVENEPPPIKVLNHGIQNRGKWQQ
jgi:DNA-binding PadR family transcriptional regulator